MRDVLVARQRCDRCCWGPAVDEGGFVIVHGLPWPSLFVQLNVSKGMAGIPHSSFLALSATAATLGLFPVAGVALLLCADRLMDSMRVVVHLLDNCVAPFVVARWEGQLDHAQMRAVFAGQAEQQPAPAVTTVVAAFATA